MVSWMKKKERKEKGAVGVFFIAILIDSHSFIK